MPTRPPLHIINPFWNAFGGSERRALALYRQLRDYADVTLWSGFEPAPELAERFPIRALRFREGEFPKAGALIFVGTYFPVGPWVRLIAPTRKIIVLNTLQPKIARELIEHLDSGPGPRAELVYPSAAVRDAYAMPGTVEPSIIDTGIFLPPPRPPSNPRFTVGRLSREHQTKHHSGDPAFYLRLVESGCDVRVMGGRLLADAFPAPSPHLALMAAGERLPVPFLHGLDCFFYRTNENWLETYGRVIFEAMACGLPVVAERRGGYVEFMRSGVDSFLFETVDEAFDIIQRLRSDPELRARIAQSARATVERIYAPEKIEAIRRFYLSESPVAV